MATTAKTTSSQRRRAATRRGQVGRARSASMGETRPARKAGSMRRGDRHGQPDAIASTIPTAATDGPSNGTRAMLRT